MRRWSSWTARPPRRGRRDGRFDERWRRRRRRRLSFRRGSPKCVHTPSASPLGRATSSPPPCLPDDAFSAEWSDPGGCRGGQSRGPNTHNRGSEPIDGIWYTPELELEGASYLPFDGSLGDHRPVVADFTQRSVLGKNLPRVVPVKARRLNSKVQRIRDSYITSLEEAFKKGDILSRLKRIEKDATFPASAEVTTALERIDNEMEVMML
ncbi:hypothetical protein THAOC_30619, partial [Thalassiosira oceanica]